MEHGASIPFEPGRVDVLRVGRAPYADVRDLCARLRVSRARREVCDTLVFTEHEAVGLYPQGAGPSGEHSMELHAVPGLSEGLVHAPGQLIVHPILGPETRGGGDEQMRSGLERVLLEVLAEVDLEAQLSSDRTGALELDGREAARVLGPHGAGAEDWILTLNLRVEPQDQARVAALGSDPARLMNLAERLDLPPRTLLFEVLVVKHVCETFGVELPPIPEPPPDPPGSLPIHPA